MQGDICIRPLAATMYDERWIQSKLAYLLSMRSPSSLAWRSGSAQWSHTDTPVMPHDMADTWYWAALHRVKHTLLVITHLSYVKCVSLPLGMSNTQQS